MTLARRLACMIQDELCRNVSLKAVLTHQNPSSLANFIFEQLHPRRPVLQSSSTWLTTSEGIKIAPLSYQQLGLWLGEQLMSLSPYFIEVAYDARRQISPSILFSTIEKLVARHEILRTIFVTDENGHPQQQVLPWSDKLSSFVQSSLFVTDCSSLQWANKMLNLPPAEFCLSTGPLFRVTLFTDSSNSSSSTNSFLSAPSSILAFQIHHIIIDGWSLKLLLEEMEKIYISLTENSSVSLSPSPTYLDYAISQRTHYEQGQVFSKAQYWARQLFDLISQPILPPDKLPPLVLSGNGQMLTTNFQISLSTLAGFCAKYNVTEYVVLLASLQLSLYLLGYLQEVTIGTAFANRNSEIEKEMLGLLVNVMVIRTKFTQAANFLSLLKSVRETFFDAVKNSLPLEYIEERLLPLNNFYMESLYQVLFVFQRSVEQPLTSSEFLKPKPLYHTRCEGNIDIYGTLNNSSLTIEVRYSTDLYVHSTIKHFVEFWESRLRFLLCNPYTYLRSLTTAVSLVPPLIVYSPYCPSLVQLQDIPSVALQVGQDKISWSKLKALATSTMHQTVAYRTSGLTDMQWPATCLSIAQSIGASAARYFELLSQVLAATSEECPNEPTTHDMQ